jgi:DNA-binding response OmpR family regulator
MSSSNGRRTILVVDDEADIRLVLEARLAAAGFRVQTAVNGREALGRIRLDPPDLVVLDLMLPGIDGFGICGILKRDQRFSSIPVVMLTARSESKDRKLSAKLGADLYLTKPFKPAELVEHVRDLLEPKPKCGAVDVHPADSLEAEFPFEVSALPEPA